jgi:hypothetical protein
LKFRARPADQIPAAELARVDTCWSAVLGLSNVEFMRTADFQVRGLLLALRAGDPFRITRALALEAIYLSAGGSRTWRRTTAFLKAAQSAADALAPIPDQEGGTEKKTYVEAIVTLAHGTANYLAGRYNAGLENALRAEQLLLERCTGVAWELNTARTYVLWSLLFQGDFNRLARVARDLGHDAQERGDLFATTNLNVFILPAIALAAGNAEEARRLVRATLAHWPQHEFTSQHLLALYSETDIDLYNGDGQAAWERISSQWPAFARSLHSHIQSAYVHMLYSRARSALASAATRPASSLLKTAEQDAGQLEREGVPQTQPQAGLIRAGLAMLRKDKQAALAHLRNAADGFAQASMHYYLAATRRRLGSLLGAAQGRELTNAATAWMASNGIQDHERMTAVLIPGFPRGDA